MTQVIVYGDESGLDEKATYFLMGGFLGTSLDWQTARSEWAQVLGHFGVTEFHSNEFFGGKGQYRGWDRRQRDSLLEALLNVLRSSRVTAMGCAIHIEDYKGLTNKERRVLSGASIKTHLTLKRPGTSQPFETRIERNLVGPDAEMQVYRVGFKYFLGAVAEKAPPSCSIDVILDRHERLASGVREYFNERRRGHTYPGGRSLQSLTFIDSAHDQAIQASDLYTYVAARQLNGHPMEPRHRRAWEALCKENGPFLMNRQQFSQQLDPLAQWNRQFNVDWGFPPDHQSAF